MHAQGKSQSFSSPYRILQNERIKTFPKWNPFQLTSSETSAICWNAQTQSRKLLFKIKTSEINFACLPRNFHKELSVCVRSRISSFFFHFILFHWSCHLFRPRAVITFSNFSHKTSSERPRFHSLSSLQLFFIYFWKQEKENPSKFNFFEKMVPQKYETQSKLQSA